MEVNETVRKFLEMLCLRVFIPVVSFCCEERVNF